MTFDAFWNLVQWLLLPLCGGLIWWMRQIEHSHRVAREYLERQIQHCTATHLAESAKLKNDLGDFKLAVVGTYVSKAELERILDRIEAAIGRLGDRVESLIMG